MDEAQLQLLAHACKKQINKLQKLVPDRLERLERTVLEGKTTEELAVFYMQGVGAALDTFDVDESLAANRLPTRLDV